MRALQGDPEAFRSLFAHEPPSDAYNLQRAVNMPEGESVNPQLLQTASAAQLQFVDRPQASGVETAAQDPSRRRLTSPGGSSYDLADYGTYIDFARGPGTYQHFGTDYQTLRPETERLKDGKRVSDLLTGRRRQNNSWVNADGPPPYQPASDRSAAARKRLETQGAEGLRAAIRKGKETLGPEGLRAAARKRAETLGAEGLRAAARKRAETLGAEGLRAAARKRLETQGAEGLRAAARKAKDTLGPEGRSEAARKRAET
ncbi:hypothetical protein KDAU_34770 [Dictyobacter aurantiacus]|uniref:Uncharacterized protein n=2 Tax=Dictyobacter aurantiacus TaxID=1936993 RepID=A0A401ZHH5_9CHLR|nr:hypothetical protein KDAU_34770 [Dictyobacter aurantiacus]